MKKILLSIALLTSGFVTLAQTVPLNKDWEKLYTDVDNTLITRPPVSPNTQNGNQSLAYNPLTERIYLVDREVKINILNSDGTVYATKPTLTLGSWTDAYRYNKIRVAEDGAIYATNFRTSAGDLFVYRWNDENDTEPQRFPVNVPGRSGESFAVYGSGNNTRLYFGGSGSNFITVATVTNGSIDKFFDINAGGGYSRSSISPISSTSFVIKTASDAALRLLTIDTEGAQGTTVNGTVSAITTGVAASQINQNYSNAEYFARGSRKYLAVYGAVTGATNPVPATTKALDFEIFEVTANFTAPVRLGGTRMINTPTLPDVNTNPNGYADVGIRNNPNGTTTFFHVVHGTGVASYTTTNTYLPVSLTSFNAALLKGQSTLTWETSSESNNKGFEVLRSTDGKDFTKVDFVVSKAQNGNSSTSLSYSYVDATAKAGLNYYQLNQVDLDGKSELFKEIKTVNVSLKTEGVTVFPNPATTHITVNTAGEDYKGFKYELFDANGKKVLSEKAKAAQQDISLGKLPSSIYYLKVSKNGTEQKTVKVIKQ